MLCTKDIGSTILQKKVTDFTDEVADSLCTLRRLMGRKDKTLEGETDLIELKKQKCSAPSEGTRASSLIHF
jgi:hypothetical protein